MLPLPKNRRKLHKKNRGPPLLLKQIENSLHKTRGWLEVEEDKEKCLLSSGLPPSQNSKLQKNKSSLKNMYNMFRMFLHLDGCCVAHVTWFQFLSSVDK